MTIAELLSSLEKYDLETEVVLERGRELVAVIEDKPGEPFKVVLLGADVPEPKAEP